MTALPFSHRVPCTVGGILWSHPQTLSTAAEGTGQSRPFLALASAPPRPFRVGT